MEVTIGLAFLAGLASFLSPCVFSLVPAYIGYLSGRSVAISGENLPGSKVQTFTHGIAFVLGFSLIFVLLGVTASVLGRFLYDIRFWLAKIGGVVIILFGLHMTGILRIPFLEYDLRPQTRIDVRRSYFSSALMGIFFSAGWSPCVGPVLGAILTLALNGGSVSDGVKLLSAYSAGLAIPFLLAALGIGWVTTVLKRYRKAMHYVEIVMGVILILVGVMLILGTFEQLARFGLWVDFGL
ncbi:cytochrome c biogenesis protein [Longilinea arvoryzae]|uniref:Cytochrome c biogenesis protein n=1 Tax=Longilinea arvoryzae TaxID=360412 RepID=A0A0S7BM23_9CHLR|nr:cytochrome c biogenesis protein CcdA [Longilinea arvoryzae]GAP14746.1 cytochrome c biogenesis protein [Longilinea arvoryzae]